MKKVIAMILSVVMILSVCVMPAFAADDTENAAKALYSLNLFLGYGLDDAGQPRFGLPDSLTREQGVLLLLRMLGKQGEAETLAGKHPFSDVTPYYEPYIGYAYEQGLTKGTSETTFSGTQAMTEQMFLTFCMRALGFQDGTGNDFAYNDVVAFAGSHGVTATASKSFTRGDVVVLFWQTLSATMKSGDKTLAKSLIDANLFSQSQFDIAKTIRTTGTAPSSGSSSSGRSSGGSSSGKSSGGSSSGKSSGSSSSGSESSQVSEPTEQPEKGEITTDPVEEQPAVVDPNAPKTEIGEIAKQDSDFVELTPEQMQQLISGSGTGKSGSGTVETPEDKV